MNIPPETIFGWIDRGECEPLDELLEQWPESPAACLAICYSMRRGITNAIESDDDGSEIMAIWDWAETALAPHSQLRQLWAVDEVARHERSLGATPEQQAAWALAREQAVSELTI